MILKPDISSTSDTPSAVWKSIHLSCAINLPFAHSSGENEDIDIIYFILATWESLINGCKKRIEILRFQMTHNIIIQPWGTKVTLRTVQMCKVNWSCVYPTPPPLSPVVSETHRTQRWPSSVPQSTGYTQRCTTRSTEAGTLLFVFITIIVKVIFYLWQVIPVSHWWQWCKIPFKMKYKKGVDLKKLSRWQHKQ